VWITGGSPDELKDYRLENSQRGLKREGDRDWSGLYGICVEDRRLRDLVRSIALANAELGRCERGAPRPIRSVWVVAGAGATRLLHSYCAMRF